MSLDPEPTEPAYTDDPDPDGYIADLDVDQIDQLLTELNPIVLDSGVSGVTFLDWSAFWDKERNAAEWLFDNVFARGRAHALYAIHKAGKSLFTLWVAAQLATSLDPIAVVYLDYEMTEDDLRDRLEDMGYGPGHDFSRLHYALLPTLPPLDSTAGADALDLLLDEVQTAHPDHHLFVVIDTTSRAVTGEENNADTYQAFYRTTGIRLKRRGCTWCRLDHAGKDPARGQRGSSAKGDDVDLVWKLEPAENGIRLKRELTRISWAKETVSFAVLHEPLRYVAAEAWLAGTAECARDLDEIGLPDNVSANDAIKALRDLKKGCRREVVLDAMKYRRQTNGQH